MKVATSGIVALIGVAVGACIALFGVVSGEGGVIWKAAGLGCAAIALFATRAVPELVTAFGIFLAALALGTVPQELVFAGLSSSGFWLLVSGIILGSAISATGLAARISGRLVAFTGPSYPRAILAIAGVGMALGVLIPSTMPRIIIMIPIATALAGNLKLPSDGRGTIGLVATAAAATLLPTYTILTANLPTIVQVGAMEKLYGLSTTYSGYLIQHLPVNILRFALLVAMMVAFSKEPVSVPNGEEVDRSPATPEQGRLLMVLSIAIAMWMTDFLHGISPAWVALAAAAVVIWPRFGMLGPKAMREQIDLTPALFFASIVTVVTLAREAGLDQSLAGSVIDRLPLDGSGGLTSMYSIYGFSVVLSHLTTAPAAPAVLAPFAGFLADASGLSLEAVSMTQVIGIATPILPYQAPPLIVAMSISGVPNPVFFRLCLWLAVAVTIIGIPLTYYWWQLIGFL